MKIVNLFFMMLFCFAALAQQPVDVVKTDSGIVVIQNRSQELKIDQRFLIKTDNGEMFFDLRDTVVTKITTNEIYKQLQRLDEQVTALLQQRTELNKIRERVEKLEKNE